MRDYKKDDRKDAELMLKFYAGEIKTSADKKDFAAADKYRSKLLQRLKILKERDLYPDMIREYEDWEFYKNPKYGR